MTNFKDMVRTVYGALVTADEAKRLAEMQRLMNLQTKSKDQKSIPIEGILYKKNK